MLSKPESLELWCRDRSPLHLLIVEDAPEDAELILLALEEAGIVFTYDRAENVPDCEYWLFESTYDVVLSDYRLSGGNADRAFDVLKQSGQDIPFILVTGSLGEEAAVECIRTGMTDYVLKDRLFRLAPVIKRALEEFEIRREKQLAIAQLEQQARREAIINRILEAMRGTLILDEVLQSTANQLHEALKVSRCLILRPNGQGDMIVQYASQWSVDREWLLGAHCPFVALYHDALSHGEQIYAQQPQDLVTGAAREFAEQANIKVMIINPLIYQQQYLGGIVIHECSDEDTRQSLRNWSENDLSLIKAIADHCAIAIHQVNLYEQLQLELAERKRAEQQLRHDALHDILTGLPNRALLMNRLEQRLQLAKARHYRQSTHPYQFAVLFLDLDRFKVINDSLGHLVGDLLLQAVAQRLRSSLRMEDIVARLGGDEFVFLLEDIKNIQEAIDAAKRIIALLQEPFQLKSHTIFISVSIGIALSSVDYQSPSQILRDADSAMYSAKEQGRACYAIFNQSMHDEAMRRLQIENDLRRAIKNHEFKVYYQPVFCLKEKIIHSFEALVRWEHPVEGWLEPANFIGIAEESGLITDIDLWVCNEASQQLKRWHTQFPKLAQLQISINCSSRHFSHIHFPKQINKLIDSFELSGQYLKIEITESSLIENSTLSRNILNELRNVGINICVDDFGTGYSSLSYLHKFPIDTLKIDRSFISSFEEKSDNQEIVRAIVNLGLNLNLSVIAEGIETEEQYSLLNQLGCHYGQGIWFSPPISSEMATTLLNKASYE